MIGLLKYFFLVLIKELLFIYTFLRNIDYFQMKKTHKLSSRELIKLKRGKNKLSVFTIYWLSVWFITFSRTVLKFELKHLDELAKYVKNFHLFFSPIYSKVH